ncbi:M50 family metallopeptidase [Cellulomonas bogoriensis]|uniref:M50 family metallopeptidase n=1 Tax=Cellulomonas bogoriensis TaxID=301388 RepID=UPI000B0A932E
MLEVLSEIWERATTAQPLPSTLVVAGTALGALVLVTAPVLWPLTRHVATVAHEGGHGVAAVLSGRRLTGIRLHSDTSGLTLSRGRPRGPGMVVTLLAGYPAPALVGLGAAALLAHGRAVGLLWLVLLLLGLLLLQIRNLFGLWVVLVCGVATFGVSWWAPPEAQSAVAFTVTWFLLLAAPRTVMELARSRRRDRSGQSDADQLARVTGVPALVWLGGFAVVALGCLALGTAWLLPEVLEGDLLPRGV